MSYELHNSGIITGSLNCFCLSCNRVLENSREAFHHIRTSSHCDNLRAAPYLNKFREQHIRKFETGYFCEFCNHLMPTTVKVNLHIAENHHIQNRGSKLLRCLNRDIIAFKNVLITECAWQGLIDNVCCICDVEFEDEDHHKTDKSHVLKVIQNPVKFGINDDIYRQDIYRQIDDATVQCLTCNKLLLLNTMIEHFETPEHLDIYTKCKIKECNELESISQQDNNDNVIGVTSADDDDCNSKMNATVNNMNMQYVAEGIDINYETTTVTCKTCHMETKIDLDNIEKHLELQRSNSAVQSPESDDNKYFSFSSTNSQSNDFCDSHARDTVKEDPPVIVCDDERKNRELVASSTFAQDDTSNNIKVVSTSSDANNKVHDFTDAYRFAKENDIDYNPISSKALCEICQVQLPFNLKSMNQHVKGAQHNKKLASMKPKNSNRLTKQTMIKFITSLFRVKSVRQNSPFDSGYLLNDKYYLNVLSFLLLTRNESNLTCLLCGTTLMCSSLPIEHVDSCCLPLGKNLQFITSEPEEFIREVSAKNSAWRPHHMLFHALLEGPRIVGRRKHVSW